MSRKLSYLFRSLVKLILRQNLDCPNCGQRSNKVVERKYLFTTLRRCPSCQLLHRIPRDSAGKGKTFYQAAYRQGFTTDMPNDETLQRLLTKKFRGGPRDYQPYLELLAKLGIKKGDTLLEYGCSWGYGAWQLLDAGYQVIAFEISKPRCQYAREKLGISAVDDPQAIQGPFDVVFSAHVLEHVDQLETALHRQWAWLKPGGLLVGITPNGSEEFRKTHPKNFQKLWGLIHPQLLDDKFLHKRFQGHGLSIGSISGMEGLEKAGHKESLSLDRWELFFAVRKPLP